MLGRDIPSYILFRPEQALSQIKDSNPTHINNVLASIHFRHLSKIESKTSCVVRARNIVKALSHPLGKWWKGLRAVPVCENIF